MASRKLLLNMSCLVGSKQTELTALLQQMNFPRKKLNNEFILPVPKYNPIFLQNKIGLHGKAVIFIAYNV